MTWTTFWQIFALAPWLAIWLSFIINMVKKTSDDDILKKAFFPNEGGRKT